MIEVRIAGIRQALQGAQTRIHNLMERVSTDVLIVARSYTPIKLGKARAGWRKYKQGRDYSILNKVIYIDKLEQGSSKQAPRGILGPTIREISRRRY